MLQYFKYKYKYLTRAKYTYKYKYSSLYLKYNYKYNVLILFQRIYLRQFKLHLINMSCSKVLSLRRHLSGRKTLPTMQCKCTFHTFRHFVMLKHNRNWRTTHIETQNQLLLWCLLLRLLTMWYVSHAWCIYCYKSLTKDLL